MKKIRLYLIVWVSGVIAGVVMVERWRRIGAFDPAISNAEDAAGAGDLTTQASADTPKAATAIMVGAKADAGRVLGALAQLTPRGHSLAASLPKWRPSGSPGAPASSPDAPA